MVVDVNLDPTQGSETGKTRPCVIVTNDFYNQRVPVIQVVPITEWSEKKARIRRGPFGRGRLGAGRRGIPVGH